MGKHFNVKSRTTCKICGEKITSKRYRVFCSARCRNKHNNKKYAKAHNDWHRAKCARFEEGKLKCIICGGWYKQLGTHITQRHQMTAMDYKKLFDLPHKRGLLSQDVYEGKARDAVENGTIKNLPKRKLHRGEAKKGK